MELEALEILLAKINYCDFAILDSTTKPLPGLRKVTTGTRVLLFTNTGGVSGYAELVRRRLIEAGKDPRDFVLGDLPWGERIPDTPLIVHRGAYYLQTIVLEPGQSVGYAGNREVDLADFIPSRRTNQGLPKQDEVIVETYRVENIDRLILVEQIVTANSIGVTPLGI